MPKVVDHEERKAFIIQCAENLIASEGYDQLTIRGLASSEGISSGMITYYFDNKDQILLAALQQVHHRYFERVKTNIGDATGIEALRRRMRASLPLTAEVKKDWSINFQFWGRATHNPDFSSYMQSQREVHFDGYLQNILEAQEQGEITPELKPDFIFEQLDGVTTGMGVSCVFDSSHLNRKKAYAVIDHTLKSLSPS